MKLSKTTLVLPVAALLVVGAAGVVLATSGTGTGPTAVNPAAASPSPNPSAAIGPGWKKADDTVLSDVLDQLVTKGTITAAQKTAILDAVTAERQARIADRQAAMQALRDQWTKIQGFLSDGQITQDELNQLPADSPLRQLTTLMDDGKITTDELRSIAGGLFGGMGGGRGFGHGMGGGMWGGNGTTPNASPSPSSGTSG